MCSVRRACEWLGLSRSAYYRQPKSRGDRERLLLKRILELSHKHDAYGYRFITTLLRREGWTVSYKKVQRLRRKEGLGVIQRPRKKGRCGQSTGHKQRASEVNEVWCWDFIHDVTEDGRSIRILSIVDEHSRFCIALEVRRSFTAKNVIKLLKQAIRQFGAPAFIRSDNGPELVAKAIQKWLRLHQVNTVYIEPGSPWQNPFVESFHSRFRNECLNREWFINLLDAKACVAEFRETYNTVRPHSGIEYKSPIEIYYVQAFDSGRATPSLHRRLANPIQPLPMLT
jgi:transposase InsO family protein